MTKEQKIQLVVELTEKFKTYPNFYIVDSEGLNVAQANTLRGLCHNSGVHMQVVKNTLIEKALENLEGDYSPLKSALKKQSSVFFAVEESANEPAKILKEFRKSAKKPVLKAACIDLAFFIGDDQLDTLTKLKTKKELLGEVIGLLQSPMRNVLGQLQSGGHKIAGVLETLSKKEE
jgi:large subunit ribosomal protein L10